MCFVRKGLDYIFSRHELKWLDDIIPESHKREKEEKKKRLLANAVGLFAEVRIVEQRFLSHRSVAKIILSGVVAP